MGVGWTHRGLGGPGEAGRDLRRPNGHPAWVWRLALPGSDHIPVLLELGTDRGEAGSPSYPAFPMEGGGVGARDNGSS